MWNEYFIKNRGEIMLKGTRMSFDIVIENWLNGITPEEMSVRYSNLSLEQAYATITYYLANREEMDAYLEEGRRIMDEVYKTHQRNPSPVTLRLRQLRQSKEKQQAKQLSTAV